MYSSISVVLGRFRGDLGVDLGSDLEYLLGCSGDWCSLWVE